MIEASCMKILLSSSGRRPLARSSNLGARLFFPSSLSSVVVSSFAVLLLLLLLLSDTGNNDMFHHHHHQRHVHSPFASAAFSYTAYPNTLDNSDVERVRHITYDPLSDSIFFESWRSDGRRRYLLQGYATTKNGQTLGVNRFAGQRSSDGYDGGHRLDAATFTRIDGLIPYYNKRGKYIDGLRGILVSEQLWCLRFISLITDQVVVAAGTCASGGSKVYGTPTETTFTGPWSLAISQRTGMMLLSEGDGGNVLTALFEHEYNTDYLYVSTEVFAGKAGKAAATDGNALSTARFKWPIGMAFHSSGYAVYVSDLGDQKVRKVAPAYHVSDNNVVSSLVGVSKVAGICTHPDMFHDFILVVTSTDKKLFVAPDETNFVEDTSPGNDNGAYGLECLFHPDDIFFLAAGTTDDSSGKVKYDSTATNGVTFPGRYWRPQTFTPSDSHTSTKTLTFVSYTKSLTLSRTATFTKTPTPTGTGSLVPTETVSLSESSTLSETLTPPPTPTRTFSRTVTDSRTPSLPPTPSPSSTFSKTATETGSITGTGTLPQTETVSDSARTETTSKTGTIPPTPTPSRTFSKTATETGSITGTGTLPQTETDTISESSTASRTPTRPPTPTPTFSKTVTATATLTKPPTPTPSMSKTWTYTETWSHTTTISPPPTSTPEPTRSNTSTWTDTGSASLVPTPSNSLPPTMSGSLSSSVSVSPTLTVSDTVSATTTKSASATKIPTPSASVPPTDTLSETRSDTASSTLALTDTATLVPTPSASIPPTASDSHTLTETKSEEPTLSVPLTQSVSVSISSSASDTEPITDSQSVSLSSTDSVTPSATTSKTLSVSESESNSVTQSYSESASDSETHEESISVSLSVSMSETQSLSDTPSVSPSSTESTTATLSTSDSLSESASESTSVTQSLSETPSLSETETVTETASHTLSWPTRTFPTKSESMTESESLSSSTTPSLTTTDSLSETDSLSASFSQSFPTDSSSVTHELSPTETIEPPEAVSRYCQLWSPDEVSRIDTTKNIMRNNFFDPTQYAPCCSMAVFNNRDPALLPYTRSVSECEEDFKLCLKQAGGTYAKSRAALSAFSCSATATTYTALLSCATTHVQCLMQTARGVYNDETVKCGWSGAMMASMATYRGLHPDVRDRTFIMAQCEDWVSMVMSSASGCLKIKGFLDECRTAINGVSGYHGRTEFLAFDMNFANNNRPSALARGLTMRSSVCSNPSSSQPLCIAPQASAISKCRCPGNHVAGPRRQFKTFPAETAFVPADSCWSHHVNFDMCMDEFNGWIVDAGETDFFTETAPPVGVPLSQTLSNPTTSNSILDDPNVVLSPPSSSSSSSSDDDSSASSLFSDNRRAATTTAPSKTPINCLIYHSTTLRCSCPSGQFVRKFLMGFPRDTDLKLKRQVVSFCAPIATNVFIVDQGTGACYQPLLDSTEIVGNFSCKCLAGSKTRTVPISYVNETTNGVTPGILVFCDQPPVTFSVQGAITSTITSLSGLIGGPAMALLQAAVITTLIDCNDDGSKSENKQALLPIQIGSSTASSWLTVFAGVGGFMMLQTLLAFGLILFRRYKISQAIKEQGEEEPNDDQHAENPLAKKPRRRRTTKKKRKAAAASTSISSESQQQEGTEEDDDEEEFVSDDEEEEEYDDKGQTTTMDPNVEEAPTARHQHQDGGDGATTTTTSLHPDSTGAQGDDANKKTPVKKQPSTTIQMPTSPLQPPAASSSATTLPPEPLSPSTTGVPVPPLNSSSMVVAADGGDDGTPAVSMHEASPATLAFSASQAMATASPTYGGGAMLLSPPLDNHQSAAAPLQLDGASAAEGGEQQQQQRRKQPSFEDGNPDDDEEDSDADEGPMSPREAAQPSRPAAIDADGGDDENNKNEEAKPSSSKSKSSSSPPTTQPQQWKDMSHAQKASAAFVQPIKLMEEVNEEDYLPDELVNKQIDREIYRAIPVPVAGEDWITSLKYGCCMARYPYVTMLLARLAFQGFAYDTVLLVSRSPLGSTDGIIGGVGCVLCMFWVISHYYMSDYIQTHDLWIYRVYQKAFDDFPVWIPRRILPHGFWHNTPFLLSFREAVDLYIGENEYLRHLSWVIYFRMVLIGIIVGVPTSSANCIIVYIALLVIMWISAIIFAIFRPHRRPVDDAINVTLSFLNGLMIILIVEPQLGNADDVFLAIVYIAMVSMIFTGIYATCEFFWWNRQEVRLAEEHETEHINFLLEEHEKKVKEAEAEFDRMQKLQSEAEERAMQFLEDELSTRTAVLHEERKARAVMTFSTEEDQRKHAEYETTERTGKFAASATFGSFAQLGASGRRRGSSFSGKDEDAAAAADGGAATASDSDEGYGSNGETAAISSLRAIRRMRLAARRRRNIRVQEQAVSRNRHAAARAAQRAAPLPEDMADNFIHRALDVLGFF